MFEKMPPISLRLPLACLLACLLLGCPSSETPAGESAEAVPESGVSGEAPQDPGVEANVAPTINDGFKSDELDVEGWAERFTGESREVYTAQAEILAALAIEPGDHVADIGAGTGLYTKPFAEAVGPEGKVWANDIAPRFLTFIEENAAKDGLGNVATVLGDDRTTHLPDDTIDVAFHSDVYHHFEYPITMNRDILRALKDDGRLFVLDFERIEGESSDFAMEHVRIGSAEVIAEIESSGFELVRRVEIAGLTENYLLEFRPAASGEVAE